MPRLSCIIPVVGSTRGLEATLVSVLEHRPAECQIVVVLSVPYGDPYELSDEVRFISAPGAGLAACARLGVSASVAPIVHLLAAGCEVAEGWTQPALDHFADPRVAAVAPIVRSAHEPRRVLAAGLAYHRGGRRVVCKSVPQRAASAGDALGPTIDAAFYRRAALEALGDALPAAVGDHLADVDLALALRAAGYRGVVEPHSEVFAERLTAGESRGWQYGLQAERLFLRNLSAGGRLLSLAAHPFTLAGELLAALPSGRSFAQLAGRAAAWFSRSDYSQRSGWLDAIHHAVEQDSDEPPTILRLPEPFDVRDAVKRNRRAG